MKKLRVMLGLIMMIASKESIAQSSKPVVSKKVSQSTNIHKQVFEKARFLGDANATITSLHYLIESSPRYANYADTLAQAYFDAGLYFQCNNLASYLLRDNPEKESLLSMRAMSLKQLNQASGSAEIYTKLYDKTKNYLYALELLQLQLSLQRLQECLATSNIVLSQDLKAAKISVPKKDNKSTQEIKVKSLVFYLQSLAYRGLKETDKAVAAAEMAMKDDADFELAKSLIDTLKAENTEVKKTEEIKK